MRWSAYLLGGGRMPGSIEAFDETRAFPILPGRKQTALAVCAGGNDGPGAGARNENFKHRILVDEADSLLAFLEFLRQLGDDFLARSTTGVCQRGARDEQCDRRKHDQPKGNAVHRRLLCTSGDEIVAIIAAPMPF